MEDQETWKPIPRTGGRYEASTWGRIRTRYKNGSMRVKKPTKNRGGYLATRLGVFGSVLVHRMVLEAFVGECPPKHEADHMDFDRTNNRPSNLRWVTRAQNTAHSLERNRAANRGERGNRAKLTEAVVQAIRVSKEPNRVLAQRHGVTAVHIWYVKTGRTWKHLPFPE